MIRKLSGVALVAGLLALLAASPAAAKQQRGEHCRKGRHAEHGKCVRSGARHHGNRHKRGKARFQSTITPFMDGDMALRGIDPGLPWVLDSGAARITGRGRSVMLDVRVKGFLFAPGTPFPGTTGPVNRVFATVSGANGESVSSREVRLSKRGNAHIHQRIRLPKRVLAPIVFVRVGRNIMPQGNWIAATGFGL